MHGFSHVIIYSMPNCPVKAAKNLWRRYASTYRLRGRHAWLKPRNPLYEIGLMQDWPVSLYRVIASPHGGRGNPDKRIQKTIRQVTQQKGWIASLRSQ